MPSYNSKPSLRAFKNEVKLFLALESEKCTVTEIPSYSYAPPHRTLKNSN